ncbi:MAG: hypothetical protein WCT14_04660 [Treponemataceae bacterium]
MKRISLAIAFFGITAFVFASEELDVYSLMYRGAINVMERYAVLRNIAEAKISGAGSLYAEALAQLLSEQPNFKSSAEKEAADGAARLLSALLGESKYSAAAPDIWRVVQNFDNPLVKADALIAIGQTRSAELLPQVLKTLSDLNAHPTPDRDAGEKVAYGAVLALEKYRNIDGYAPVFFTATGWYSRRVKDQAMNTLPFIVDDPSQALSAIIRTGGYEVKLLALEKENESKAGAAAKASVALIGLEEGWRAATNDIKDRIMLSRLRKLSIDMLNKNESSAVSAVPLLEKSYMDGVDTEERIAAINALSRNKSDEAARALSSFLMVLNEKRRAGDITQEDERIVRAVIPAIGTNGNVLGRPALQAVEFQDWTNAVKLLAVESLKRIK